MSNPAAREETIFNVAHQLSDPQDRAAYLNDACGDDKPLRERVERLLEAELHANEFLANNPLELDGNKTPCSGPDLGTVSASMVSVAPAPGDVLEDYEIIERIGGNMGLVFKARHRLLDKIVALKLLPADAITDPARLARFRRELKIMGQLEHPNLVTAVDARIVGRWHMVVMEFIDGTDLERLVETRGALPIADACEAARQAALALQYAHQHGLIHRDIKPSNLMLTHAGTIKVIDMGLAVIQEESTGQLTRTGLVMGTMRYCAPEQFRDASRVDIRVDIYSLGCTLFHLLTGKPPYSERTTVAEVVQAHLNEPFPDLAEALPDAPAELNAILARMTAKDPGARFATPGEVVEALEPFARGADLGPLVPATTQKNPPRRPAGGKPPTRERHSAKRPGIRWLRVAAVLVLLLAVVGAVLFSVNPSGEDASASVANRVVVFMDTTATNGIYDPDNVVAGRSNADELYERLVGLDGILLPSTLHKEGIGVGWVRESFIIGLKPGLVIIHRSSFFHPHAAILKLKYPPFDNAEDYKKFQNIYDSQDMRLRSFISLVGSAVPHCQFLVYSRGTDTNWLNPVVRSNWTAALESSMTNLQGRIHTMVIPEQTNGARGTFRDPRTMEDMKRRVREVLKFPKRQEPERSN
jgi:serine/threonine protein kinase